MCRRDGERDSQRAEATQALLSVARSGYRPFQVLAFTRPGEPSPVPLLEARGLVDGRPAAYVCSHFVCQQPVTDPEALRQQLDAG